MVVHGMVAALFGKSLFEDCSRWCEHTQNGVFGFVMAGVAWRASIWSKELTASTTATELNKLDHLKALPDVKAVAGTHERTKS